MINVNSIEASQTAAKARRDSIKHDLSMIENKIKSWSKDGQDSCTYQVKFKENIDLIIHELREKGFKVKRSWFMHASYNEIEVKW